MQSTPLIIISGNQAHITALRQACCAPKFDVVRDFSDFSELQFSDVNEGSFILAVISECQRDEAVECALDHTVFALVENEGEFDASGFEGVFQYPARLGRVVDGMHNIAKQKELHKRMAPIILGEIVLDPKASSLSYNDNIVRLTEKESAILIFLSEKNSIAASRQSLLDEVWGYAKDAETHTLETHIYRLRQKIKIQLSVENFLVTNDDGYILNF